MADVHKSNRGAKKGGNTTPGRHQSPARNHSDSGKHAGKPTLESLLAMYQDLSAKYGQLHVELMDHKTNISRLKTVANEQLVMYQGLSGKYNELTVKYGQLQDELMDHKSEMNKLKLVANDQHEHIVRMHQNIDDLEQYGRRENVCFSNLKFDEQGLNPMTQVIDLCDERGVEVKESDLVDVHPLPTRNGRAKRIIARFKDRKLGQKVMMSRKNSKNIDPNKKKTLAADPMRGIGIQPNITPCRAALLSQAKTVVKDHNFDSTWIDIKTGSVLLKKNQGDRPLVVRSTEDIMKLCAEFCPNEHFFSVSKCDLFKIYDPESPKSEH